jgi:hypothetical protein
MAVALVDDANRGDVGRAHFRRAVDQHRRRANRLQPIGRPCLGRSGLVARAPTRRAVSTAIGLHVIDTGFATTIPAYPAVMIGAFGVPQSILLHLVSLRQLSRHSRSHRM